MRYVTCVYFSKFIHHHSCIICIISLPARSSSAPAAAWSICCSSSLTAWRKTPRSGPRRSILPQVGGGVIKVCGLTCSALHSFKGLLSQFSTGLGCVGSVQHQVKHTLLKGGRGIFKVVENPKSQQHPCERIVVSESCDLHKSNTLIRMTGECAHSSLVGR